MHAPGHTLLLPTCAEAAGWGWDEPSSPSPALLTIAEPLGYVRGAALLLLLGSGMVGFTAHSASMNAQHVLLYFHGSGGYGSPSSPTPSSTRGASPMGSGIFLSLSLQLVFC